MSKSHHFNNILRDYKRRTKRVGRCSIYDIITDKKGLTRQEKISYIRHAYSYYDGNYDIFFDKHNNPLPLRDQLNTIIEGIVDKRILPNVLTTFNKKIQTLRKAKNTAIPCVFNFDLKESRKITRATFEKDAGHCKAPYIKKGKTPSLAWLKKARIAGATLEEIEMIEFYIERHELFPVSVSKVSFKRLLGITKLWLLNHKNYAKKFQTFYKTNWYMFDDTYPYANDNNILLENNTINILDN